MRVRDDQPIDSKADKRKNEDRRTEVYSQKSNIDERDKWIDESKKSEIKSNANDLEPH